MSGFISLLCGWVDQPMAQQITDEHHIDSTVVSIMNVTFSTSFIAHLGQWGQARGWTSHHSSLCYLLTDNLYTVLGLALYFPLSGE